MSIESVWKALKREVREGGPSARFACLKLSHGHVPGCIGAERVQGERTHRAHPAGAKTDLNPFPTLP